MKAPTLQGTSRPGCGTRTGPCLPPFPALSHRSRFARRHGGRWQHVVIVRDRGLAPHSGQSFGTNGSGSPAGRPRRRPGKRPRPQVRDSSLPPGPHLPAGRRFRHALPTSPRRPSSGAGLQEHPRDPAPVGGPPGREEEGPGSRGHACPSDPPASAPRQPGGTAPPCPPRLTSPPTPQRGRPSTPPHRVSPRALDSEGHGTP